MFLTQPFVNYNFGGGWYVTSSPIVTANWETPGTKVDPADRRRRGPGGQDGGKLPVNFMLGAYYNAIRPEFGPTGSCARR